MQDSLNAAMAEEEKDVRKEKFTLSISEENRTHSMWSNTVQYPSVIVLGRKGRRI